MTNYDKAVALVQMDPLPDDAEAQLDAIVDAEPDPNEKMLIESLSEALFLKRNP